VFFVARRPAYASAACCISDSYLSCTD